MLKASQLASETSRSALAPAGVAIVGLDHPSRRMLRALRENLDAEVRWICDADRERLEKQLRRCPGARITTRIDRVLSDPAVDAVFVAGPVHTHYRLVTQALEAGKHVFVHTPLAPCSELADEIAEAASAHGRIVTCGTTFLHTPAVRAMKRALSNGEMGELYFVSSSRVATSVAPRGGSVVADLGPRELSILLYWLVELPAAVRATARAPVQPGVIDIAFITLTFTSGLVASLELSRVAPRTLSRTVLVGSRRMAVYDEGAREPVRFFDRGDAGTARARTGNEVNVPPETAVRQIGTWPIDRRDPLAIEVDEFISAVRDGEGMEFQTALARSVVCIAEAAEHSLGHGSEDVPVGLAGSAAKLAEALRPAAERLRVVS